MDEEQPSAWSEEGHEPVDTPSAPDRAWTPFDPGDIPALPRSRDGAGRVVAVTGSPDLVSLGWAVSVAIELARAWSESRAGVVLVDADLLRPRMHHALRVDNTPGLAEVLAGSTSVQEATRTVDPDRLFCVPSGITPDDPERSFDLRRWSSLCRAFSDAGITVVVFMPQDAPWADEVVAGATDLVKLVESGDAMEDEPDRVPLAILGPMPFRPTAATTGGRSPGDRPPLPSFEEAPPLDNDAPGIIQEEDPTPDDPSRGAPVTIVEEASQRYLDRQEKERARRRARKRIPVVAGLAAVAGGTAFLVAMQIGSRPPRTAPPPTRLESTEANSSDSLGIPGTSASTDGLRELVSRSEGSPLASGGDTSAEAGPLPIPMDARFSVGLAAYSEPERATRHIDRLATVAPDIPTLVIPVEVDGTVYHRVVAGFEHDSAQAARVALRLSELTGTDASRWLIRETGWVFEFGTFEDGAAAEARANDLRRVGIPATIARIEYTDQTVRYPIYAGGYATPSEAAFLESVIRDAGFDATLAPRAGLPPRPR